MAYSGELRRQITFAVLKQEEAVSHVAQKYNVARKTIYKWIFLYKKARGAAKKTSLSSKYLRGANHPRSVRHRTKGLLIKFVTKNPSWGSRILSKRLKERGITLGNHGVWKLLLELNLSTKEKREEFAKNYAGPGRIAPTLREQVVAEIKAGLPITRAARRFNVARKTIYAWMAQLQATGGVEDQYVSGFSHPRALGPEVEKRILDLVTQNPALSSHKIAPVVGLSNHGAWNILKRNNLTLYEQRVAFAQGQAQAARVPVFGWLFDRVRLVWETFVPTVAPAPPPFGAGQAPQRMYRMVRPFLLSLVTSSVFSLAFIWWINLLGSQPFGTSIGLLFATVALFFGSFFFAYSMKYYFTLAIVLSFSQQAGGIANSNQQIVNSNGKNGNGSAMQKGGFLSWILGLGNGGVKSRLGGTTPQGPVGLEPSLEHVVLKRKPFISIHIPFYNEKNVAERILAAVTAFDWANYEVVIADDSTDDTTLIIQNYIKNNGVAPRSLKSGVGWTLTEGKVGPGVVLKHLHRTSRAGFKGGALAEALKHTDPRAEFVVVFDADFVPYPDTLELFLKYFKLQNNMSEDYTRSQVAVVQGYQWHVLNKSENWITRGVRSEYAGSYIIERSGQEILGALKMISGSVYMIRKDVLDEIGWETSITEDFELTLKLYEKGYKVVYTPYIQAPAECVSTIKRLVRQRMRWAEGHSHNIRLMFTRLLFGKWADVGNDQFLISNYSKQVPSTNNQNPNLDIGHLDIRNSLGQLGIRSIRNSQKVWLPSKLTLMEKLEFLYLSPYYLQAFFFLVGTISWLISETVFAARLPFWTSLWGWSLVLTNFLALPLLNGVGLFLEEAEERDFVGLLSFIALSYIVVPFQAYAAIKGFLEEEEGPWFRTPKTGHITDIITRGRFFRFIAGILPGRAAQPAVAQSKGTRQWALGFRGLMPKPYNLNPNPYLSLATANSRFSNFEIKPRRKKLAVRVLISFMIVVLVFMNFIGELLMQVQAQDGAIINEKYDTRLLNVPKEYEKKQLILDKKIGGELSKVLIESETPTVKFIVESEDNQDYWAEISLEGGNSTQKSLRKYQVIWKDIFPNVDIEYEAYDGFLKENIYLKNNKAQREFIYKIKTSENVALDDSKGGYIMAKDRTTSKDLFMLKSPQGIDKRRNRIDYKYRLEGDSITLYPNRPWQFKEARYPILIDPPVSVVEWYEALVKVGENCANTGCEKDGDVIDIKPAGWMWGIEERKDFVIVKIPVLTDEEVKEFVSRTIRPPEPNDFENPQEVKDPVATLPASEREKVFDTEGLVRYGIDYTKIADPDTLKEIRDKNGDDNPVLDSSQDKNIIKKKDNPLASIIPNERRLAYDLNLINRKSFWEKIVKDVRAAGTITTSIGSSGRDYSTISAWETAQQGNLVTLQEIHRGEMYKDSTFVLSATQTIDGSTTDSSYYMHLTAAATERHNGTAGTGVVIDMNDGTVAAVAAFDPNTIVEWLEMRNKLNAPNGSSMIQSNVDGVLFQNLLIHDFPSVNSTRAWRAQASGTTLRNTIIYDGDDQGLRGNIGFAVTIQNLTIWGMGNGIFEDGGTFTITNTIAMNNTRDFDIDNGSLTNVMCQVNDADCNFGTLTTCTNCLYNRNNSTQFVDTNYATANFHLKTGSDAIDAGTTIAGFSDDIDSDTRPIGSAWDIGADEIPENLWGLFFLVPFFPAFLKRLQSRKKLALARVPDKKGN